MFENIYYKGMIPPVNPVSAYGLALVTGESAFIQSYRLRYQFGMNTFSVAVIDLSDY